MLDSRLCGYMPIHRGYLSNKVMVREGDVVLKDLKSPVRPFFENLPIFSDIQCWIVLLIELEEMRNG